MDRRGFLKTALKSVAGVGGLFGASQVLAQPAGPIVPITGPHVNVPTVWTKQETCTGDAGISYTFTTTYNKSSSDISTNVFIDGDGNFIADSPKSDGNIITIK